MGHAPPGADESFVCSCALDKEDLHRLFAIVQAQLEKAVKIQIANTNPDLFDDFDAVKQEIAQVFIISYNINKKTGDSITGYNAPDLYSDAFPEQIDSIYVSTKNAFEAHAKFPPRNNLELFLDFRRGKISIDFITMPSNPTQNSSVVNISGLDETWVIETYDKIKEFFDARASGRMYIHRSGVYDIFLFAIVMPLFLYAFYRFEIANPAFIDNVPRITIIAIYVYSFLFIGVVGRLLFQYGRWLFPLVEYTSDRRWNATAQKALLVSVVLGIIGTAVYDAIRFVLR